MNNETFFQPLIPKQHINLNMKSTHDRMLVFKHDPCFDSLNGKRLEWYIYSSFYLWIYDITARSIRHLNSDILVAPIHILLHGNIFTQQNIKSTFSGSSFFNFWNATEVTKCDFEM